MKGNTTIIVAVAALIAGALMVILLNNANETIAQNEVVIKELKSEKTTLETAQADLTQKLNTANSTISKQDDTITKATTQLEELSTKYDLKVAEYETFVGKAAQELAAKDEKINTLNNELSSAKDKNRDYDSRIKDLNSQMVTKDQAIEDISRRLESSENDRDHLLRERDKLIAEKAELEKQFQDIVVLRQKVQRLQVELMASKKLEWLRRGFYGSARKKGGAQLMGMSKKPTQKPTAATADLNVEVRRDGTVKIVPAETNTPPDATVP